MFLMCVFCLRVCISLTIFGTHLKQILFNFIFYTDHICYAFIFFKFVYFVLILHLTSLFLTSCLLRYHVKSGSDFMCVAGPTPILTVNALGLEMISDLSDSATATTFEAFTSHVRAVDICHNMIPTVIHEPEGSSPGETVLSMAVNVLGPVVQCSGVTAIIMGLEDDNNLESSDDDGVLMLVFVFRLM